MSTPQYDEPWKLQQRYTDHLGTKYTDIVLTNSGGVITKGDRTRFMRCVNFLAGVPDTFINSYLHNPGTYTLVNLMLACLKTGQHETTPLCMLIDEAQSYVDSCNVDINKPYVSRKRLEDKLIDLVQTDGNGHTLSKGPRQRMHEIYTMLGIHCFRCDGWGVVYHTGRSLSSKMSRYVPSEYIADMVNLVTTCDNCNGTGRYPHERILIPDTEEPT